MSGMEQSWEDGNDFGDSEYYIQEEHSRDFTFGSIEGYDDSPIDPNGYSYELPSLYPKDDRGRQDSGYYSPDNNNLTPEQRLLQNINNVPVHGMSPSSTATGVVNTQQIFTSQSSSTPNASRLSMHISESPQGSLNNTYDNTGPVGIAFYDNYQAEEDQPKPKTKRTRKRKVVSMEEQVQKQEAFLERNRLAAKKCRAKRKVQQDGTSERVRNLSRANTDLKNLLVVLQAAKDDCMQQVQAIRSLPGVEDELKAIEAGNPIRDPAFFWHESGLLPISEMPIDYQLPVLHPDPNFTLEDYAEFGPPEAEMTRDGSEESEQQFTGPPQKRRAVATKPEPIDTTVNMKTENSSSTSTPLTGVSDSQNSAKDSGIDVSPQTPKLDFPGNPHENGYLNAQYSDEAIDPNLFDSLDFSRYDNENEIYLQNEPDF